MEGHSPYSNRSRSPSASVNNRNVSPSPHAPFHDVNAISLDPSMISATGTFSDVSYASALPESTGTEPFAVNNNSFLAAQHPSPHSDNAFVHNQQFSSSFAASFSNQLEQSSGHQEENFSNLLHSNPTDFDFTQYPTDNTGVSSNFESSLLLDPQQQTQQSSQGTQLMNSGDLSGQMGSPHLLTPEHRSSPGNSHTSPPVASPPFYSPQHSRHTSLDPVSAAYMTSQSQTDWQGMLGNPAFQGHRRAPSEHSDVSSVSHHSPYTGQQESFETVDGTSPSLVAQNDPILYDNALGIEAFTLSEQQQQQQQGLSPRHSPFVSPQIPSQDVSNEGFFLAGQQATTQFPAMPTDIYAAPNEGVMANMQAQDLQSADGGQLNNMGPPPSINVEFAPPSRIPSFGPGNDADFDGLSPPSRSRGRSKSDPFGRPNPNRPHSSSVSSTGSMDPAVGSSPRSLSPFNPMGGSRSNPGSRDVSPASKSGRRLSTSSIESRNYILDLADPQRSGATTSESRRTQKHPATFQCTLCPKRFTRAYNLRSHLRTHTDERPFVCTVCGKAFARQHDRKRHEGLHSGEKKFVCRGDLSGGAQWGCGRRFARADALGRHFRSEAGRICIKPLLDEEADERNRIMMEQQQQAGHLQPVQQPLMVAGLDSQSGFTLPAALLAQYPALQTLQWDQIATTADDPNDISGRSSFDASSGGEYGYDDDDLGGSFNATGSMYGINNSGAQNFGINPPNPNFGGQEWQQ
ncbi:hypothetical protein BGW36DRAFT_358963 [Talaromyces proteolyticus]|uniref:C2H2-type domain-containing protein n=1 Tax=Talaromyces proteolyticus TaxID=1131652 RepID=A0AAD4Q0G8_9EURO|nr:uncharacterized protein BGW36DRAFT_358963 [Talaromyces proteolyticus]KAH8697158.1 hypothetical protein BGW36DRAFT_358963 [Talaromyces proteolyticus]